MNIKIIACSDRGVFVGVDTDGEFNVISLDDVKDIELGDTLSSATWDDTEGAFKDVRNISKNEDVGVCIEDWECSSEVAFEILQKMNSPTSFRQLS